MSTLDQRAQVIYDYLKLHQGERFTMAQLCKKLGLQPSGKTQAAIRRARDMATDDGLHFPPAVPANKFTYTVTSLPGDALDPTLHMGRIRAGVQAREDVGYDFMSAHEKEVPRELRPIVKSALAIRHSTRQALAATQRAFDDMVVELVKIRRDDRND